MVVVLGGAEVVRAGDVVVRGGDGVVGGAVVVRGSGVLVGLGVVGVEVLRGEVVGAVVRVVEVDVEMGDEVVCPGSVPFEEPHPPATRATASTVAASGPNLIRDRRVTVRIAVASSVHPLDA